jgi:hypothetical protein
MATTTTYKSRTLRLPLGDSCHIFYSLFFGFLLKRHEMLSIA